MNETRSMEETASGRSLGSAEPQVQSSGSSWSRIPLRVWLFAAVVAVLLFGLFGFWGLYLFRGHFAAPGPTPTAIIWTVTPSRTSRLTATPTLTPTLEHSESEPPTPTPPADIVIGGYVKVSGTDEYGLSLRAGPGPDYARMDIAAEEDVFVVVEGPRTASGAPWWRIRDPENEEREWWAVGNYLQPVERP